MSSFFWERFDILLLQYFNSWYYVRIGRTTFLSLPCFWYMFKAISQIFWLRIFQTHPHLFIGWNIVLEHYCELLELSSCIFVWRISFELIFQSNCLVHNTHIWLSKFSCTSHQKSVTIDGFHSPRLGVHTLTDLHFWCLRLTKKQSLCVNIELRKHIFNEFSHAIGSLYFLPVIFPHNNEAVPDESGLRLNKKFLLDGQFAIDKPQKYHKLKFHPLRLCSYIIKSISLNKSNPYSQLMIFDLDIPPAISYKGHLPPIQTYNNAVLRLAMNVDVTQLAVLNHHTDLLSQNHKAIFLWVLYFYVRHFDQKWHF